MFGAITGILASNNKQIPMGPMDLTGSALFVIQINNAPGLSELKKYPSLTINNAPGASQVASFLNTNVNNAPGASQQTHQIPLIIDTE